MQVNKAELSCDVPSFYRVFFSQESGFTQEFLKERKCSDVRCVGFRV